MSSDNYLSNQDLKWIHSVFFTTYNPLDPLAWTILLVPGLNSGLAKLQ